MSKILIVEDDTKTAQAILTGLQNGGYEPLVASSGEAGLRLLDAQPFDAIVLDWMLPGRDGIEVVAALRKPVARGIARDRR